MANGDLYRAEFLFYDITTQYINTFHFKDDSGGATELSASTAASDFWGSFGGAFTNLMQPTTYFYKCTWECVGGPNVGDIGVYIPAAPIPGTFGGGSPLPGSLAICLFRNTGKKGRKQRGRIFFGPCDNGMLNDVDQGIVDTAMPLLLTLAHSLANTFTTQTVGLTPWMIDAGGTPTNSKILNSGISPVICHRQSRKLRFPS